MRFIHDNPKNYLKAQGVVIDEVESTLSGDIDLQGYLGTSENVRNGYEKIKVTFFYFSIEYSSVLLYPEDDGYYCPYG
jgi:hypothetical protein